MHNSTVRIPTFLFFVSALQKIQNKTYIKMRSVTTRRIKKSAKSKKRTSSPQKVDSIGVHDKNNFRVVIVLLLC